MKAMTELRLTETNAADDSSGRAFGLDGNLYLPVLCATVGARRIFSDSCVPRAIGLGL
jgi:hypothetical protein